MMPKFTWRTLRRTLLDYVLLTIGAALLAINIDLFLIPNKIVSGGATGIATILHIQFGLPTGAIVLIVNIPLFVLGIRYAGGTRFAIRTVYATVLMSVLTDAFVPWVASIPPITQPLLFTLYGGLLDGIGMGLVFRGQGTTGGTDVVARLFNRRRGVPLGQTILVVNSAVLILAVIAFGLEPAMYALILTFVGARVVDVVQGEADYSRTAIIISAQAHAIKAAILSEMERGVTLWSGRGGYTEHGLDVVYCVVARTEISILKRLIQSIDPRAFVVIADASEVLGEGFREWR
ncbi:MAG TPA: YitT family protein [Anaerolineae bacterium]|nr:YitT family protein [Anaerolineae bacterium]